MIKRYKAVQVDGLWYVGQGSSVYFPSTESTTKADAEREALIWTMQEAYAVAEKIYKEGVDKGLLEPESFGDYLC